MKTYEWNENTTLEEAKNGAYWERNMLVLLLANEITAIEINMGLKPSCGWYYDLENNWIGWKRVISIDKGSYCFHIPDDFDIGNLPEIEPNWDGHTTKEKYKRIMKLCGCKIDE